VGAIVAFLVGLGALSTAIVKTSAFSKVVDLADAVNGLAQTNAGLLILVLAAAAVLGGYERWGRRDRFRRRRLIWGSLVATAIAAVVLLFVGDDSGHTKRGLERTPPPAPVTDPSPTPKGDFDVKLRANTLTIGLGPAYGVTTANELVELPREEIEKRGHDLHVRVLRRGLPEGVTQMVRCGDVLFVAAHTGWIRGYSALDGSLVAARDFFRNENVGLDCVRRRNDLEPRLFAVRREAAEVVRIDIRTRYLNRLSKWVPMRERGYEGPADIDAATSTKSYAQFSDVGRSEVLIVNEDSLGLVDPYAVEDLPDAHTLVPVGSQVVAHQPGRHCASVIDVAAGEITKRIAVGSSRSFGASYGDAVYLVDESGELTLVDVGDRDRRAKHVPVADAPIDADVSDTGDLLVATDERVTVFSRASLEKAFRSAEDTWPATTACGFPPAWAEDRKGAGR
jgi:hypothetical protein